MSGTRFWVLVKGTEVDNSIVWDGEGDWSPPPGHIVVETTGMENAPGPGWTYIDGVFYPPPLPPPPPPAPEE